LESDVDQVIEIGRLLRAGVTEFVVGCRISQIDVPAIGALVHTPLSAQDVIYGLIYDIHIDDDGLVRQLVTAGELSENIIADNRVNRNVPLEISVMCIGHRQGERISHLLPPRPPLSLDAIYLCNDDELRRFTRSGRFGYFRHILRQQDLPTDQILAAHLYMAGQAHAQAGDRDWLQAAKQELITLLRDDYPSLMRVLGAITDIQEV
jgi:hypothetical protein